MLERVTSDFVSPLRRPQNEAGRLDFLSSLLRKNADFMVALQNAKQLGLNSWAIGAGIIRSMVWDELHGFVVPTPVPDWDLVYYDANLSSEVDDANLKHRLHELCPQFQWDVVNQATVHHWLSRDNDRPVSALASLEEGIASWPETATCVAVTLDPKGNLVILAPLGLADLFDMRVRFNSRCLSVDAYRRRLSSKQFKVIWPRLEIIPA